MRRVFFLLFIVLTLFSGVYVYAETNINATSTEHYAWEDTAGWLDFYDTNSVFVWGTRVQGYASSSLGDISLDCATSPSGNICSISNYGICNGPGPHGTDGSCANGDASGELSGYAWNDTIGWISFNCDQSTHGGENQCTTSDYGVSIDSNGNFSGYAWNDIVGWISFNCANDASCSSSDYKVVTEWRATSSIGYLISSIFDTQKTTGALLHSIIWHGDDPGGETCVDFQIAVSNTTSSEWSYIGPDGTGDTYYGASCSSQPNGGIGCAPDNTPICVKESDIINYRYLRYKVRLMSNMLQTQTPRVDNIILNWSP